MIQMLFGSWLWLKLGPLEDPFPGKGSFNPEWAGGFTTDRTLVSPEAVLERTALDLPDAERPVQAVERRVLDDREVWILEPRRMGTPLVFDGATGERIRALPPETVGRIVREEVAGRAAFQYLGEAQELWIDRNDRIPTYRFRFEDRWTTDVHADPATAQVIQRPPGIWRALGPFLGIHMMAATGRKWVDGPLLGFLQVGILLLVITGWRLELLRFGRAPGDR